MRPVSDAVVLAVEALDSLILSSIMSAASYSLGRFYGLLLSWAF